MWGYPVLYFLLQVLFDLIVQSVLNKKKTLHHFRQNTPIEAGADDRIRPNQECSPHPGKKQQESKSQTKPNKNRQSGECSGLSQLYKHPIKCSRTQRQLGIDPATDRNQQKKLPAHREKSGDPNLRSETSETATRVNKETGCLLPEV